MQIGPLIVYFELMHAYWYFKAIAKTKQPFILQYAEAGWGGGGGSGITREGDKIGDTTLNSCLFVLEFLIDGQKEILHTAPKF